MTLSWRRFGALFLATAATLALTAQLATAQVNGFSKNQLLKLPLTAGNLQVKFIVRGLEPSNRTDNQGTIYVSSIRGVPGGVDAHPGPRFWILRPMLTERCPSITSVSRMAAASWRTVVTTLVSPQAGAM